MFASAPIEFRLVALCCQWPAGPLRTEELDRLLAQKIDWDVVLRLAERHRVWGFVHQALGARLEVPSPVRDALATQSDLIVRANLLSLASLVKISKALEQASVPFLILKGLPLSHIAFGTLALRHSKDIDILIHPGDVDRVDSTLCALGFARAGLGADLNEQQAGLWQRYKKHHEYVHSANGARVEVHWRPFNNTLLNPLPLEAPESLFLQEANRSFPVLSREEMLLNLCVHGASHAWFRLKWITDVAALLQGKTPESIAALLVLARSRDLDRPVEQALLLCNALSPAFEIAAPTNASSASQWLAQNAALALLEGADSPSAEVDYVPRGFARSQMMLRRSGKYKLEEILVQMASPIDWKTTRLPVSLQFAYPLLRIPLWLKRRWLPRAQHIAKGH